MTFKTSLLALPLLALAACNAERDPANDTTTLSVDERQVDQTLDQAGNLVEGAADEVQEAARNAAPVLEDAARDVGNAAERAGQSVENGAERAAGEVREETRDNPPKQ
jgi:vacuolar-type H+-ATPase subunit H